jgi:hypothetical protein
MRCLVPVSTTKAVLPSTQKQKVHRVFDPAFRPKIMALSAGQQLIALPPPPPATDLIQSALFLPLSAITRLHRGKKIRTIGQYVQARFIPLCASLTRQDHSL